MFGSELNSAFAPFNSDSEVISPFLQDSTYDGQTGQVRASHEIVHKSTPVVQQHQQQHMQQIPTMMAEQQPKMTGLQAPQPSGNFVPSGTGLQGSQDPRIAVLVNELRKQQRLTASMQQQSGYLDKLFSKKKDMLKIVNLSLIIVLAMSIHFIIDYYMKNYLKMNDLTFERELILRLLYPVSIVFILWNMKAFLK